DVRLLEEGVPGLAIPGPVLRFEHQARLDIGAYVLHLADAVRRAGARLLRADVASIEGGDSPCVVLADGGRLHARAVVSASNVPFHATRVGWMKQAPYRTYVVAGHAPRDSIPDALYWDDGDPYHYVRLYEGGGEGEVLVLAGGADHKVGQEDDP